MNLDIKENNIRINLLTKGNFVVAGRVLKKIDVILGQLKIITSKIFFQILKEYCENQ